MSEIPSLLSSDDRARVAARLRELIATHDHADPGLMARRLGVSEVALRISIDVDSPRPTADVLVAAIRYYGVDPNWLLTGEYNATVHRHAVDGDRSATAAALTEVVQRRNTPPGTLLPTTRSQDSPAPEP